MVVNNVVNSILRTTIELHKIAEIFFDPVHLRYSLADNPLTVFPATESFVRISGIKSIEADPKENELGIEVSACPFRFYRHLLRSPQPADRAAETD